MITTGTIPLFEISKSKIESLGDELKTEMVSIISPYYKDPRRMIETAFRHNTHVYLAQDAKSMLLGFFMTGLSKCKGKNFLYLGLSGVRNDLKRSGIGKALYSHQMQELASVEAEQGEPFICWATTASPFVFLAAHSTWGDVNPRKDGSYTEEARVIVQEICSIRKTKSSGKFPFLIKEANNGSEYSEKEKKRIAGFIEKSNFKLFEKIGLKEEEGDRLILVIRKPLAS